MAKDSTSNFPIPIEDTHYAPKAAASRRLWERNRARLENKGEYSTPISSRPQNRYTSFDHALKVFGVALKISGFHQRGVRNALDIRLTPLELHFDNLPDSFDGYRILHLTDLHLDMIEGLGDAIAAVIGDTPCDLCVMTGDFRKEDGGPYAHILPDLSKILGQIQAPDGVFATLGNHDDHRMARAFERMGMDVLANETRMLERGGHNIRINGIDDVHRFYTPAADIALGSTSGDFSIALVHSPEMAQVAADGGNSLYICGHTHGGQVCLPGGKPLITHLTRHHQFAKGLWRCGNMIGYTSSGAGCTGLPVRFFSRGEVTLLTLRKSRKP